MDGLFLHDICSTDNRYCMYTRQMRGSNVLSSSEFFKLFSRPSVIFFLLVYSLSTSFSSSISLCELLILTKTEEDKETLFLLALHCRGVFSSRSKREREKRKPRRCHGEASIRFRNVMSFLFFFCLRAFSSLLLRSLVTFLLSLDSSLHVSFLPTHRSSRSRIDFLPCVTSPVWPTGI